MLKMHVCFFHSEKRGELDGDMIAAGSSGILKMHVSLKMHIFIGLCPTSGLFRESGGMAGREQAPAGNHRHGHLGRAGRNEKCFLFFFFLTTLFLLKLFPLLYAVSLN